MRSQCNFEMKRSDPNYMKRYYKENKSQILKKNQEYCVLNKGDIQDYRKVRNQQLKEQRVILKHDAIQEKGGKCVLCGYEYDGQNACVFDFHHKNPEEKLFDISHMKSLSKIREELKKCDLICANCHRLLHDKEV